jgi:hypothetical protein
VGLKHSLSDIGNEASAALELALFMCFVEKIDCPVRNISTA